MDQSDKVKAQCQTCRKSFGGTFEKLNATAACPKCGASGDWWRPVETRMIQRSRLQAQQEARPYQPPPAPGGHAWVPREEAKHRGLVLGLGIGGIVMAPLGLITGPIGLVMSLKGLGQIRRKEVPSDGMLTAGIALCIAGFLISVVSVWFIYSAIDELSQMDEVAAAAQDLIVIGEALEEHSNLEGELPTSLEQLRRRNAHLPLVDPWGNAYAYTVFSNGARITCYGADGKPGGSGVDEDMNISIARVAPR